MADHTGRGCVQGVCRAINEAIAHGSLDLDHDSLNVADHAHAGDLLVALLLFVGCSFLAAP
eukprot:6387505-Amphidinium_carterae.1